MIMPKNYTLQNASNLGWLFYKDYYRQEPNVDFISTQGKEKWYKIATLKKLC